MFAWRPALPQTHNLYGSETIATPGAPTHTGSGPPAAVQTAHATHDLSVWRLMATVFGVAGGSGRCETLRGTALCWDLRAADADGTGS